MKAKRITRESRRQLYQQFDIAFALMSVIPLLICCYLLAAKFFSLSIFLGLNGVYFLLATVIALLGQLFGRQMIRNVMQELDEARAEAEWLLDQLVGTDDELRVQFEQRKEDRAALHREAEGIEDLNSMMLRRQKLIEELKQEIDVLHHELGRPPRYKT